MNENCEHLGRRQTEVDGEVCERDRKRISELKEGICV